MNKYVTSEIMGGLGNQLFQIFHTIAYALKYERQFFFEDIPITNGWRTKEYWNTFLKHIKDHKYESDVSTESMVDVGQPSFDYHEEGNIEDRYIRFRGYFQSYKYFYEQEREIFELIKISDLQREVLDKVPQDYSNVVSLHFRVGDYAQVQEFHPLLSLEYYRLALVELISDTHKDNWEILCFCEEQDMDYISEKIDQLHTIFPSLIFSIVNHSLDDWEQVILMSLCRHHIIANSSFSWWGAYIKYQDNPSNTCVYYPTTWFGPGLGYKVLYDLFPSNWKNINI